MSLTTKQFIPSYPKHSLIFLLLLLGIGEIMAQYPGSSRGGFSGGRSSGQSLASEKDASRDTLSKEVYIYYLNNLRTKALLKDSSLTNFHLYDPIRSAEYEHFHLGNLGSAHRQLVFQPRFRKGFDVGYHNYDLYLTQAEDIPYYELEKAYSDIYFSQSSQEKTSFRARFSKPIAKDTYLGIYYNNINNEGIYDNQVGRANAFTATLNFTAKNQKYRGFLSYTANTVEQKENGGADITNVNFRKTLVAPGRPVNTSTGEARYFERDLNYTHFYLLQKTPKALSIEKSKEDSLRALVTNPTNQPTDTSNVTKDTSNVSANLLKLRTDSLNAPIVPQKPSNKNRQRPSTRTPRPYSASYAPQPQLPETGRKFTLKHNLHLRRSTFKYVDVNNLDYYGDFLTDDRGVRNFIETQQVENTFSIQTFRIDKKAPTSFTNIREAPAPTQKDLIEVGATHLFTDLYQEPLDSTVNNVFLYGKIDFTPSERLKVSTYGHLGMLKQIGDYYLKGDVLWDTKKLGKLQLSFTNQLYTPSLIQQRFLVTQRPIWQNNFKKVLETSLSATYSIPKLKTDITFHNHLISNFIYTGTDQKPAQLDKELNITQLIINNQIDVSIFHLKNTAYLQNATESVIRFPQIYSIHRLWMDLKLFKVMESQLGGEVRLNTAYQPDNYFPLTGQFFLQDQGSVPLYPVIDVFFNFRIQSFRFFIIYENLFHQVPGSGFHYMTYTYPIFDPQLRFGFRWMFLD